MARTRAGLSRPASTLRTPVCCGGSVSPEVELVGGAGVELEREEAALPERLRRPAHVDDVDVPGQVEDPGHHLGHRALAPEAREGRDLVVDVGGVEGVEGAHRQGSLAPATPRPPGWHYRRVSGREANMTTTDASPSSELLRTGWMISSDSHVIEPPDLWAERMDADLARPGPRVVREADGDWWYVDGYKTMSFLGIQTGDRFDGDPDSLRTSATFAEVRPAAYDPAAYLSENEQDGVWASVLYPSQGLVIYCVPVTDVVTAAMHAYNDWLADFCSEDTTRLKGIAMINVDDPDEGAAELERCRRLGLCGALITVAPPARLPYRAAAYERFWATAEDLDMPLSLHVGTDRADPELGRAAFRLDVKNVPPSAFVNKDFQVRQALRRPDPLRRVRAPSEAAHRDGRARAVVDPVLPRPARLRLHQPAGAGAGVAALRRHLGAAERLLPPPGVRLVPGGRRRRAPARPDRRRHC